MRKRKQDDEGKTPRWVLEYLVVHVMCKWQQDQEAAVGRDPVPHSLSSNFLSYFTPGKSGSYEQKVWMNS
jgi:hypothetical protein